MTDIRGNTFRPVAWPRRLLASAGAALVLALGVMAADPGLHQWLHPDAGKPDHACVITLFQQSGIEPAAEAPPVVAPLLLLACARAIPAGPNLVAPRYRLNPGRAPPGW